MADIAIVDSSAAVRAAAGSPVHKLWSGGVDLWAMAKPGEVKFGINPTDAPTSGRATSNALMHRAIVGVKDKITVAFRPLCQAESEAICALVYRAFIPVDYISPRYGQRYDVMFYAQVSSPSLTNPMVIKGTLYPWAWDGLELTLVEQ